MSTPSISRTAWSALADIDDYCKRNDIRLTMVLHPSKHNRPYYFVCIGFEGGESVGRSEISAERALQDAIEDFKLRRPKL